MAKDADVKDVKDAARAQPAPSAVEGQDAWISPSSEARVPLHTEKELEGAPSRSGESSKKTEAAESAQELPAMAEEDLVDYEEGDSENHESLSPESTQACSESKRSHKKVCLESNDSRTESGDGREPKAAAQAKPEVWITLSDTEEEGEVANVQSNALAEGAQYRNTKFRVTSKLKGRSNRPDEAPSAGSTDVASVESTAKGSQGSSGDADQLISNGEQPSSWDDWPAVYKWYTRQHQDYRWLPMFEDMVGLRNRSSNRNNYHIYDVDVLQHCAEEPEEDTHRRAWVIGLFHESMFMKDHRPGMTNSQALVAHKQRRDSAWYQAWDAFVPNWNMHGGEQWLNKFASQRDKYRKRLYEHTLTPEAVHNACTRAHAPCAARKCTLCSYGARKMSEYELNGYSKEFRVTPELRTMILNLPNAQQKARGAPHTGGQGRERPQGGHRALPTYPPQAGSRANVRESDDFEPDFSGDDLGPSVGDSDHHDDRSAPLRCTSWIPLSQSTVAAAVAAPCALPVGVSLSSQSALGYSQQSLWERERHVLQQQVDGLHRDLETERKERAMLSKTIEALAQQVAKVDAKHRSLVKNYKGRLGQLVWKGCIPRDRDDHDDHPAPKRLYPDSDDSA